MSLESSSCCRPTHGVGPESDGDTTTRTVSGSRRGEAQRGFQGRSDGCARELSYPADKAGAPRVPKGITIVARIAALMTAYDVSFVEVRGDNEVRGRPLASPRKQADQAVTAAA